MSGADNILRLAFVLLGVLAPALVVQWATGEEDGTYRTLQVSGHRSLSPGGYEKFYSSEWLSASTAAELAKVQAQIKQVEAQIEQEQLRLAPR